MAAKTVLPPSQEAVINLYNLHTFFSSTINTLDSIVSDRVISFETLLSILLFDIFDKSGKGSQGTESPHSFLW